MPWWQVVGVVPPLPHLHLLHFPPFPGTHFVDLFLQWRRFNTPQFVWWLTALTRWERETGWVWQPLVALTRVAASLWGSFQTEMDSRTSCYKTSQTLWSELYIHLHIPVVFKARLLLWFFFYPIISLCLSRHWALLIWCPPTLCLPSLYLHVLCLCMWVLYVLLLLSVIDRIDHALSPHQPLNLQSGLLCSARYTVDQRWYRAKVVDQSSNRGKVKIEKSTLIAMMPPPFSFSIPLSLSPFLPSPLSRWRSKFISLTTATLKMCRPPALVLSWTSIKSSHFRCSSVASALIPSSTLAKERYIIYTYKLIYYRYIFSVLTCVRVHVHVLFPEGIRTLKTHHTYMYMCM